MRLLDQSIPGPKGLPQVKKTTMMGLISACGGYDNKPMLAGPLPASDLPFTTPGLQLSCNLVFVPMMPDTN